jgi:hypothetical protein
VIPEPDPPPHRCPTQCRVCREEIEAERQSSPSDWSRDVPRNWNPPCVLSPGSGFSTWTSSLGTAENDSIPVGRGLDHLSFTVASDEDLDRWTRWLDAHDIERSPVWDHNVDVPPVQWRVAMFDLLDPAGIQLEFVFVREMQLSTVTL